MMKLVDYVDVPGGRVQVYGGEGTVAIGFYPAAGTDPNPDSGGVEYMEFPTEVAERIGRAVIEASERE